MNKTGYNSMSESDEDDSDDQSQTSGSNKNNEKSVVLNNLSYADLPIELLQSYQVQRLTKKNVVLTTTVEKFRRNSVSSSSASSYVNDFDNGTNDSSDGSLNNFNAITANINNGFNETVRKSDRLTSSMSASVSRTPSSIRPSINERVMPMSAKSNGVEIRPAPTTATNSTPNSIRMNGSIQTATSVNGSNNNNNYVLVGSNMNGAGVRILPQQATPSSHNNNANVASNSSNNSYLKYYLVSNDSQKGQLTPQQQQQQQQQQHLNPQQQQQLQQQMQSQQQQQQVMAKQPDNIRQQEIKFRALTPLESANYIEFEVVRTDKQLTYDDFYSYDHTYSDYFDPNDIKLFYGNDGPSKFTMTNDVKRKASNEDLKPFKRVCKMNFFDL